MTLGEPLPYLSTNFLREPSCDLISIGFFFDSVIGLSPGSV